MAHPDSPVTRFESSGAPLEVAAHIAAVTGRPGLTVLFATSSYDLATLGTALAAHGRNRVVGAVSGRVIGDSGIRSAGVSGFHLPDGRFRVVDARLDDVGAMSLPELRARVRDLQARLGRTAQGDFPHRFAILLVDAEARCEERLAAVLGMELNGVPLVGGSAGDLYFNPLGHPPGSNRLLHHDIATRSSAILCLVDSSSPIAAFCHTHYVHTDRKLVITDAEPGRRLVRQIDGRPALEAYANACGLHPGVSHAQDFAPFPLMIRIGGQYYPRGMQRIYPDGALEFACALERGLVVSLGRPGDHVGRLAELFSAVTDRVGNAELVIGIDCAARTASMERQGLTEAVEALMRRNAVSGFASLGEQFNTVHANNSFTCLAIGADP